MNGPKLVMYNSTVLGVYMTSHKGQPTTTNKKMQSSLSQYVCLCCAFHAQLIMNLGAFQIHFFLPFLCCLFFYSFCSLSLPCVLHRSSEFSCQSQHQPTTSSSPTAEAKNQPKYFQQRHQQTILHSFSLTFLFFPFTHAMS